MTSYPPTLEELRASFIAEHPGYTFVNVGPGAPYAQQLCPIEPATKDQFGRITPAGPNEWGERYGKWIMYLIEQGDSLVKEAGIISLPQRAQQSMDSWRRLWVEEYYYQELCRDPKLTPAARIERERQRELAKLREQEQTERAEKLKHDAAVSAAKVEEERKAKALKFQQDLASAKDWSAATIQKQHDELTASTVARTEAELVESYRRTQQRASKIAIISERTSITPMEAEAILARLYPTKGYTKDTLLALKALNSYAAVNGIRAEDAITVITEYST